MLDLLRTRGLFGDGDVDGDRETSIRRSRREDELFEEETRVSTPIHSHGVRTHDPIASPRRFDFPSTPSAPSESFLPKFPLKFLQTVQIVYKKRMFSQKNGKNEFFFNNGGGGRRLVERWDEVRAPISDGGVGTHVLVLPLVQ